VLLVVEEGKAEGAGGVLEEGAGGSVAGEGASEAGRNEGWILGVSCTKEGGGRKGRQGTIIIRHMETTRRRAGRGRWGMLPVVRRVAPSQSEGEKLGVI
jgi:hypothetical protein